MTRLINSPRKYFTDRDLAARWGVSRDTVWRWKRYGKIPHPLKLGDNSTRWLCDEIGAWEEKRGRLK